MKLRVLTETARAVATGVTNLALGRGGHSLLTLRPGDPAPDFTLPASDGREYTLSSFLARKYVVIAWFPKFMIPGVAWWWGLAVGGGTAFLGSFVPAWTACRVKVSEVFARVG